MTPRSRSLTRQPEIALGEPPDDRQNVLPIACPGEV
jgi:hypothetical protein